MSPSILVLSLSPIERDPRVLRQIALLKGLGEVHTAGYGAAPDGVASHLQIPDSLGAWRHNYRLYYALVLSRRLHQLYFGAPWVKFLLANIAPGEYDIIVANDANVAPVALSLQPRLGWHSDLHEYATRQGEDSRTWRRFTRPINRWMVRNYVTRADSATTVSQGLAEAYREEFGIDARIVPNAAPYRPDISTHPTVPGQPLRLVYSGAMAPSRKLERMIDAVALVERRARGSVVLDMFLMPGDAKYRLLLEERATAAPGGAVRLREPVSFRELVPAMAEFDVGFYACPPSNFNQERALPNKLFEFVQARLAIVSGPSVDMARCIEENSLGVVARGFDVEDLAAALESLTVEAVDEYKSAADVAAEVLSSERSSAPWHDAVLRLAQRDGGATGRAGNSAGDGSQV
ncbi:glycosyltransferase [Brachybacterium sp. 107]|uniref:glycosyltransferase n=1 Tax=Brachybacterium sp. 107 TaxID=3457736 RepID=UPI004033DC0B